MKMTGETPIFRAMTKEIPFVQLRRIEQHVLPRLLLRSLLSYGAHACGIYAAAIAFFGVLSIFPLLLLLVTLFALVLKAADAASVVLNNLAAFFPSSSDLLITAFSAVTSAEPAVAGVGLAGLLWSAMGVFMSAGFALNRVWNVKNDRNIFVQYAISAGLALSVGLVVLVSLILSAVVDLSHFIQGVFPNVHVPGLSLAAIIASNAINFIIVAGAAALLYRWLPRAYVQWRDVVAPAAVVALVGDSAKFGFSWYLTAVAHLNRIYGPVAAVAGLMLWMFVAAVLLLFGAELCHQIALLRAERGKRPAVLLPAPR